jgi:formylglycine-generating enzyme
MFKIFLIVCILCSVSFLWAQTLLHVHTTSGTSTFNLNEITDITYSLGTTPDQMIFVQGGTFNNGTSDVTVSSFYMGKYEVTQAAYQVVMGVNPSYFTSVSNGPVEEVSWFKAIEYCNRYSINEGLTPCYSYIGHGTNPDNWPVGWNTDNLHHIDISCNWTANGYRLPTEAEWQYAARGGNQTHNYTYSGSEDINAVAWYNENSVSITHTVGTKSANELGLFDMTGNVWEWCWDIYGGYPSSPQTNPHGANQGSNRVARGGGWYTDAIFCTVFYRCYTEVPTLNDYSFGFRCVRVSP